METKSTQQEILLMTGTRFAQRQGYQGMEPGHHPGLSEKEQLEEACWNGLLPEMLPEIAEKAANGGSLYLWQIREANHFIELELGESPLAIDHALSIDPPSFLSVKNFN